MNEFEKTLLNLRSLRAYVRNLETIQLEEALNKMTTVVQERRKEQEAIDAQQAKRDVLLASVAQRIQREGMDIEALIDAMKHLESKKNKRSPRPAKYRYVDDNGKERTWTGQGRTPTAIQEKIDSGASMNQFLI